MYTRPQASKNSDFYKDFKGKYAQISASAKNIQTPTMSSADRIAEFRRKIESSFGAKIEQRSSVIDEESYSNSPKFSLERPKYSILKPHIKGKLSKGSSISSIQESRPRLEDILPLDTIVDAKSALLSATEDKIQDIPYLYSFTLSKFSRIFEEKLGNR